jgi:hypothetical protein
MSILIPLLVPSFAALVLTGGFLAFRAGVPRVRRAWADRGPHRSVLDDTVT